MNLYATLVQIKDDLGITGTDNDTELMRFLEAAGRTIDNFCNRFFYVETATKYFDGGGEDYLLIPDLLSITSVGEDSDGDEDYTDYAWATTDYYQYPPNKFPKTCLEVNLWNGDYSVFTANKHNFRIIGSWGYGDGISTSPYSDSGDEVEDAGGITATATSITVTDADNFSPGQTILIESEQCYVSAYDTSAETLTVTRAVNGTTGAIHAKDTTIYIWEYPMGIVQACLALAEKLFETRGKAFKSEKLGDYSYTKEDTIPEPERALLTQYKRFSL